MLEISADPFHQRLSAVRFSNFVAKRWERRESNFLEEACRRIAQDIRAIARQWQASQ